MRQTTAGRIVDFRFNRYAAGIVALEPTTEINPFDGKPIPPFQRRQTGHCVLGIGEFLQEAKGVVSQPQRRACIEQLVESSTREKPNSVFDCGHIAAQTCRVGQQRSWLLRQHLCDTAVKALGPIVSY
jgi:hypothetical protein